MSGTRDPDFDVDDAGEVYTTVGGLRVKVVDDATAERADLVVCGIDSYFADDVHTVCAECGAAIVHRGHTPHAPRKVCTTCAARFLQAHPETEPITRLATVAEVLDARTHPRRPRNTRNP